ncbi:MAG: hypothetical protein IJW21_09195 [Clostridia bacterium]|nr:hypothetical protein [Clostridia bacterium]
MNKNQYIFTLAAFIAAMLLAAVLFTAGLLVYSDSGNRTVLVAFCAVSGISFLAGLGLIAAKRKKLTAYEAERVNSTKFTVYSHKLTEEEILQRLAQNKYSKKAENAFRRTAEDTEGGKTHYDITFIRTLSDFEEHIEKHEPLASAAPFTYDICFVFLKNATREQLEFFERFITKNIAEKEVASFPKFPFPAPIIITENEIYCIKAGSFLGCYSLALGEAQRILGVKH